MRCRHRLSKLLLRQGIVYSDGKAWTAAYDLWLRRQVFTETARWEQAPAAAGARGHGGNRRLHQRWQTFTERKKKPVVANVAIAREVAGWCWSLATQE